MSRKLTAALVALALAGGVYLGSGTANASNMGFKLERDFAFVQGFKNLYYMSTPLFNGLGDIAGATGGNNKCANTPDGQIDTYDQVCDLFVDRGTCATCSLAVTKLNTTTCQFETVKCDKNTILGIVFQGIPWRMDQDPNRDIGYVINVSNTGTPAPTNRAVIVGSHDPSWTGLTVSVATCARTYINVPYHTMYQKAAEILCGLEGTDWTDANSDGKPDTCPNGLFDTVSGKRVTVTTFDNVVGSNEFPNTDNTFIVYSCDRPFGTTLVFAGNNFSLNPGEGYLINLLTGYQPRTFLPPHF